MSIRFNRQADNRFRLEAVRPAVRHRSLEKSADQPFKSDRVQRGRLQEEQPVQTQMDTTYPVTKGRETTESRERKSVSEASGPVKVRIPINSSYFRSITEGILQDIVPDISAKILDPIHNPRLHNALNDVYALSSVEQSRFEMELRADVHASGRLHKTLNDMEKFYSVQGLYAGCITTEMATYAISSAIGDEKYRGFRVEVVKGSLSDLQNDFLQTDVRSIVLMLPGVKTIYDPFHIRDIDEWRVYLQKFHEGRQGASPDDFLRNVLATASHQASERSCDDILALDQVHWMRIRYERRDIEKIAGEVSQGIERLKVWLRNGARSSEFPEALRKINPDEIINRFRNLPDRLRQEHEKIPRSSLGEIKAPIHTSILNGEQYTVIGNMHALDTDVHHQGENDYDIGGTCGVVASEYGIKASGQGDQMSVRYTMEQRVDGTSIRKEIISGITEHDLLEEVFVDRNQITRSGAISEALKKDLRKEWEGTVYDDYKNLYQKQSLKIDLLEDLTSLQSAASTIAAGYGVMFRVNSAILSLHSALETGENTADLVRQHKDGLTNHGVYCSALLLDKDNHVSHFVIYNHGQKQIVPLAFMEIAYFASSTDKGSHLVNYGFTETL